MSRQFICFSHIKLEYANAIAGMGTHGFPSIGAFLGFCESINIDIKGNFKDIQLSGVLILSHNVEEQVYGVRDNYRYGFKQKRTALNAKKLTPKPIIEEGYLHADLSLIVELKQEYANYNSEFQQNLCNKLLGLALSKKIAGGNIISIESCHFIKEGKLQFKLFELYPFTALVNASSYFTNFIEEYNFTSKLEAFLKLNSLTYYYDQDSDEDRKWQQRYPKTKYIVPLHVGYKAISDEFRCNKDTALRSEEYDAVFVEPIFSFGEWVCSASKLINIINNSFEDAFWEYAQEGSFYLFNTSFCQKNEALNILDMF